METINDKGPKQMADDKMEDLEDRYFFDDANEVNAADISDDNYWAMLLKKGELKRFNDEIARVAPGHRANISWSNLSRLDLRGAHFARAYLFGTDFSGSDLRGIDFTDAILDEAVFVDADLRETRGLPSE